MILWVMISEKYWGRLIFGIVSGSESDICWYGEWW